MPKVPTYDGPQVRSNSTGNVSVNARANANQFGAGVGQVVSQVGEIASVEAVKWRAANDQADIKSATNALRKKINERTRLAEDGYYNLEGKDAYDAYDATVKELDDFRSEISEGLSKRQRDAFNSIAEGFILSESESMSVHAANGRRDWHNGQDEAMITQAQEDGSLRWHDVDTYTAEIDGAINNLAKRNGWSPEERELKREQSVTAMHTAAIENIIKTSPESAQEYFDANKDSISGSVHDDIQSAIDVRSDALWVQAKSDVIRMAGGSRTERLNSVREMTSDDPDKRRLLMAQVEHDFAQEKAASQEARISAYNTGAKAIVTGQSALDFAEQNPDAWNAMSGDDQARLLSMSKNPNSITTKTNPYVYHQIRGLIGGGDKQAAAEVLMNNLDKLSISDSTRFMDELYKADRITENDAKNAVTDAGHFNDWSETLLGREPSKGNARKEFNERRTVLFGMYQEGLDQWRAENEGKKVVPHSARQEILDRMNIRMNQKDGGWAWFDKEVGLNDIPVDDLNDIRETLKARGYEVTAENILKLYTITEESNSPELNREEPYVPPTGLKY